MYQLMSLPLDRLTVNEYSHWRELWQELRDLGCHGVEAIWGGDELPGDFPAELTVGYHLTFYPDWLDFYREDKGALLRKFGSMEAVRSFYGGWGAEHLLDCYRADLARNRALGAAYIVYHVSDVSLEEGYTYRWLHSNGEVIEAAAEAINRIFGAEDQGFELLLENQWWPGFTFTEPEETARLLEAVRYPRKGIMLDTGHLMHTNCALKTPDQAVDYIHSILDRYEDLGFIKGVHLHQSLTGNYAKACMERWQQIQGTYQEQMWAVMGHIFNIDTHKPFQSHRIHELLERLTGLEFLCLEQISGSREEHAGYLAEQVQYLNH